MQLSKKDIDFLKNLRIDPETDRVRKQVCGMCRGGGCSYCSMTGRVEAFITRMEVKGSADA
jgi:hypothetical protein